MSKKNEFNQIKKKNSNTVKYWKSINSKDNNEGIIEDEFQNPTTLEFGRRQVLKLMGASLALAGAGSACRRPESKILPYSRQPEEVLPGVANYFATMMPRSDGNIGLIVESHEGRPTKIEGNKEHNSSFGSSDFWAQSSILQLYDPDRSRCPIKKSDQNREKITWFEFEKFSKDHFKKFNDSFGTGLVFLIENDDSPTFLRLKRSISNKFPKSKWIKHDQLEEKNIANSADIFFGANKRIHYNLKNAKVILSIQSDFLMTGSEHLKYSHDFSFHRKIHNASEADKMNRLYVAEASFTITGANADHRIKIASNESLNFLNLLCLELFSKQNLKWPNEFDGKKDDLLNVLKPSNKFNKNFISELASDLILNKGKSLILVGEEQDQETHCLSYLINIALMGQGKTFSILHIDNNSFAREKFKSISELNKDIINDDVDTLVIIDSNPSYTSSERLNFSSGLKRVKTSIHLGLYDNETAKLCDWHLPMSHFLETWGDGRSYLGEASIMQPLISPLHKSKSKIEFLSLIMDDYKINGYDLVQKTWRGISGQLSSLKQWKKSLHDGVIPNTSFLIEEISKFNVYKLISMLKQFNYIDININNLELLLRNDYSLGDGRYSNISWLQEMPDPISKLTWGNALYISPFLAKKIGLKSQVKDRVYLSQIVEISINDQRLKVPTFVLPGINDYSLSVSLGYGRSSAGSVGDGIGIDVYSMLGKNNKKIIDGVKLKIINNFFELSSTQEQFAMNGEIIQEIDVLDMSNRKPTRDTDLIEYKKDPYYVKNIGLPDSMISKDKISGEMKPIQMTDSWPYNGNKWGMVIDLSSCIGCNFCSIACQAENNIPIVGEKEVKRGRSMHWLRVDRYFTGDVNNPKTVSQPVPCMHCENAPCEPVCPVAATAHDDEGLNAMVYNRCIGTRYCANNCPYKVRRFNYFDFSDTGDLYVEKSKKERRKLLQMQKNPNVTVRYRGVMEKCTYCTQRISKAKIEARRNGENPEEIPDGVIIPACAQSCPTKAITFGNLNDKHSEVFSLKKVDRNYDLLDELNVRPRTSYLSKLRNPNPKLV